MTFGTDLRKGSANKNWTCAARDHQPLATNDMLSPIFWDCTATGARGHQPLTTSDRVV